MKCLLSLAVISALCLSVRAASPFDDDLIFGDCVDVGDLGDGVNSAQECIYEVVPMNHCDTIYK